MDNPKFSKYLGLGLPTLIILAGGFMFFQTLFPSEQGTVFAAAGAAPTASTTVVVGNAAPVVSAVTLNNGGSITLTANATTAVNVNATISDNNGCGDINNGTTTIMIYRSAITSSTCFTTADNLNCYRLTDFTASSTCASNSQNTTTTFGIYYFAQATDASSSFVAQNWLATVIFKDANVATGTADSSGVELLTLTAINVTTSSINYGTVTASSTTGSTNQVTTSTNAGNSSTTLQLSVNSALTSGANSLATSTTQTYSTSTFTFQGTSTFITGSPVTVNGFFLTSPTSTTTVDDQVFWGLTVPAGTATGTYNGVNLFTSLFQT